MKSVWKLATSSIVLLLLSSTSSSAGMNESTMPTQGWGEASSTRHTDSCSDSTCPITCSNDNQTTPEATKAVATPSPPVYSTGSLSAEEFTRMRNVQSWVTLALEPLALALMGLSAAAFLQDRHSPSNIYLAAICLVEAWYMAMVLVHNLCRLSRECFGSRAYVQVSIWSVSYTGMAARRCVYILSAFVSMQRLVAVALPLKARSVRLLQKPWMTLLALVMFSLLMHLYRPIQYNPVLIHDGHGGSMWTQGFSSQFRAHKKLFLVLADVTKYLMTYLPLLLSLVTNALLVAALVRHRKDANSLHGDGVHKQSVTKSKSERQLTVMILGSTLLTMVLNTPININEAVSMYSPHYGMMKREHYLYLLLRSCFSIVSHMCDLLVTLSYLILSTAFRRRFLAFFTPCRRSKRLLAPKATTPRSAGFSAAPSGAVQSGATRTSNLEVACVSATV